MKKILLFSLTIISTCGFLSYPSLAQSDLTQEDLTNRIQVLIPNAGSTKQDLNYVDIAKEIQYWIFVFIGIIAVAYIIYIGAKLLWAPGNTEEMTSSLKSLAYVVV